ncbi:MAG: hypothetical protein IJD64_04800 [Clostridia bacterium]|nr:hypothetical protein [Clostridia bacterium]
MLEKSKKTPKKPYTKAVVTLILLILVTLAVFLFYRLMMNFPHFEIVLIAYMVLSVAFVVAYLIYNRGMTRRGVTPEMLPDDWSEEQKTEFIEDGIRRQKKSRWMILPIFAFLFTFAIDAMELFVIPFFVEMFTK